MVVFARPIAVLMQSPKEAIDLTATYVRICGAGIFFIVAYNVIAAIFRGLGDSKTPLLFVFIACLINIVGDLNYCDFKCDFNFINEFCDTCDLDKSD